MWFRQKWGRQQHLNTHQHVGHGGEAPDDVVSTLQLVRHHVKVKASAQQLPQAQVPRDTKGPNPHSHTHQRPGKPGWSLSACRRVAASTRAHHPPPSVPLKVGVDRWRATLCESHQRGRLRCAREERDGRGRGVVSSQPTASPHRFIRAVRTDCQPSRKGEITSDDKPFSSTNAGVVIDSTWRTRPPPTHTYTRTHKQCASMVTVTVG